MPKLSDDELETFLGERGHILRIATNDVDGMPRLSPLWFTYRDGAVLFTPRAKSVFLENLRRDQRIALSVDEDALPYRKLSVQGVAEITHEVGSDDEWRDVYREIACRFIDDDAADRYLTATIDQPRALVSVPLANAIVSTWRMPLASEPGTGIWAGRYYADGSRMDRARHADG